MMDDTVEKTKIDQVLTLMQEIAIELQNEGKDVSPLYQSSPDKWFVCYSKYLRSFQTNFNNAHATLRIHVGKHRDVEVRYYIHYGKIRQNKKSILNDKLLEIQNDIREYIADNFSNKYQRVDERFMHWDAFLSPSKSVTWDDLINDPDREKAYLKNALIEMWSDFENVFKVILEPNKVETNVQKVEVTMLESRIDIPLNQILYGPPGTGKTYNTVNKALEILNIDIRNKPRKDIKTLFDENANKGRIVFTTFHQSMCYEDFIEGLKPLPPAEDDGYVKYDVVPGIFRRICDNANIPKQNNFEEAYQSLIREISVQAKETIQLQTKTGRSFEISLNGHDNLNIYLDSKLTGSLTKEKLISQLSGNHKFFQESYLYSVIEYLKLKHHLNESTEPNTNFVLIIDEINRGNISQIFGELITLIEEDKRQGKPEALEVTLPYSHDKFSVPTNLYIIGTMNTADRSIEALDTALRRRFCFEEMKPLYDLPQLDKEIAGVSLNYLLQKINKRIEKLVDKDHMIGHSYLMSIKDVSGLKNVFHNKIIPLLQEYFYGDYGKIGLVLREGFFLNGGKQDSTEEYILEDFNDYRVDDLNSRHIYRLQDVAQMSDDDFIGAIQTLLKSK